MSDLTIQIGYRQAQIAQHLWSHGPATVHELHTVLARDAALAYTTVLAICCRLLEKGLLERRRVGPGDVGSRAKMAYVYSPYVSEAAVLCHPHDRQPVFMRGEPV